jgi:hypothetical protein
MTEKTDTELKYKLQGLAFSWESSAMFMKADAENEKDPAKKAEFLARADVFAICADNLKANIK